MTPAGTLIGDVTVRETAEGAMVVLPPARTVGFGEGTWLFVLKELRWLLIGSSIAVGLWTALFHFGRQWPALDFLIEILFWLTLMILGIGLLSARDALLTRWAPLTIELKGRMLTSDRQLLGGLMRSTDALETDEIEEFSITTLISKPSRHDEPALLSAEATKDGLIMISGEYPTSWAVAIAKLLASRINARRPVEKSPVRVSCDEEYL
jgi:hypothetical protein